MDLSDLYGAVNVGVKASHEEDFTHLPVDSYVSREHLEDVQESFWRCYLDAKR